VEILPAHGTTNVGLAYRPEMVPTAVGAQQVVAVRDNGGFSSDSGLGRGRGGVSFRDTADIELSEADWAIGIRNPSFFGPRFVVKEVFLDDCP
jgi:hypothetical protein